MLDNLGLCDFYRIYWQTNELNSSFTDFPLRKLPPETDFFFKEDPRGIPWEQYRL